MDESLRNDLHGRGVGESRVRLPVPPRPAGESRVLFCQPQAHGKRPQDQRIHRKTRARRVGTQGVCRHRAAATGERIAVQQCVSVQVAMRFKTNSPLPRGKSAVTADRGMVHGEPS